MSDTLQEQEDEVMEEERIRRARLGEHGKQVEEFPVGCRVESTAPFAWYGGVIPVGTKGTVTGHCDDGRAWIFFDGYDGGHTFHGPHTCLRVITKQPASAATEPESMAAQFAELRRLVGKQQELIKQLLADKEKFVSEHHSLRRQNKRLVEALRQIRQSICEQTWGISKKTKKTREAERLVLLIDTVLNEHERGSGA